MGKKQTYEELEQRVKELEDQNLGLRQLKTGPETSTDPWQRTFDAISDAICILDNDGKFLQCNDAMGDLLGKSSGEIINHTCWELVHGTSEPIENCPVVRMRNTLQRETMVLAINDRWFDIAADPLLDQAGNLIGAVHIISDITESKQIEEALQETEERYRALFDRSLDSVYIHDFEGNFIDANPAALKLFGYTKDEIRSLNFASLLSQDQWKISTLKKCR